MTFEEWFVANKRRQLDYWSAKEAWDEATAAERQRCREIVEDLGRYVDIVEMLEQIGE